MIRYPLAMDTLSPEAIQAAMNVLRSGQYTMGENVSAFEAEFAAWTGARYAVMVNSGSSANLLMIDALMQRNGGSLVAGDGVLVPVVAWSTTIAPLIQLGLLPVFCDITLPELQMDFGMAQRIVDNASQQERPKALLAVHILGKANDMTAISRFCSNNNLVLIEDACEGFGAFHENKHVGTFGRMGSHSMFFSHQMSTMEGGFVTTDDIRTADTLRTLRAHGWIRDRSDYMECALAHPEIDSRFLFYAAGYNVRPLEIQGAIGLVQLGIADKMLAARCTVAYDIYSMILGHTKLEIINAQDAGKPPRSRTKRGHSWMNIAMTCKVGRRLMQLDLATLGVETRPIISGNLLRQPAFKRFGDATAYPVADYIHDHGLMIGCPPYPTQDMMLTLGNALESVKSNAA